MKRPTKSEKPTADVILDAASKLFYARGLQAVSLDEIAAAADLTKRTLYYHFPTKDDLVIAYMRRRKSRAAEKDRAPPGDDPIAQLLSAFDQLAVEVSKPGFRGCPFVNALAEINDASHAATKLAIEHKQDRHQWFEALLKRARVPQPAKRARQIMVLWEGAMVRALVTASASPVRDARDAVDSLVRDAL